MSFKSKNELGLSDVCCKNFLNDLETENVWSFFQRFEKDSDPTDLTVAEESYFDNFLFCDPSSANSIKKEDFLKFLPIMTTKYKELGYKDKKLKGLDVIKLNDYYLLVNVTWNMIFVKNDLLNEYDDIKATYILKKEKNGHKIIFHLDHQKLSEIV